ncbi:MAG: 3-dehydroquinate synthase [Bacteroidales bacterium]|nr:3-dehydroquinate synthase [Bacteroidales bacterium]
MTILPCTTRQGSYEIVIGRGVLRDAGTLLDLRRKVLVVTDSGVPASYARTVLDASPEGWLHVLPQGEGSKNLDQWQALLSELTAHGFTRADAVVAVGGGMVGDLAGFAAASYMRGIDFYNIPTTLLSQLDSSVGGKTGVDFAGIKNLVGAFKQPAKVLVDPDCLKTLDARLLYEGLAEGIKMAATCDAALFDLIAGTDSLERDLEAIITGGLRIKRDVVERDTDERGLRRVLNFGHTVGHAIEAAAGGSFYHGECVAAGMIACCSDTARARLLPVLRKYALPSSDPFDTDTLMSYVLHDKKMSGQKMTLVYVERIGSFEFRCIPAEEVRTYIDRYKQL